MANLFFKQRGPPRLSLSLRLRIEVIAGDGAQVILYFLQQAEHNKYLHACFDEVAQLVNIAPIRGEMHIVPLTHQDAFAENGTSTQDRMT